MTLDGFILRALDVPFKRWGRDYTGWDCWGSVYVAYRDVKGILLPDHTGNYPDAGETTAGRQRADSLIREGINPWSKVARPKPLDVALFRMGRELAHVALYLGNDEALHAEKGPGTFVENLNRALWRSRLEGIYRYVG